MTMSKLVIFGKHTSKNLVKLDVHFLSIINGVFSLFKTQEA